MNPRINNALRKSGLRWAFALVFWTGISLAFAGQFYLSSSNAGWPVSWAQAMGYSLVNWYLFAALSVPAMALAGRFPFERARWGRTAFLHLAASFAFSILYILLRSWVGLGQSWMEGRPAPFLKTFDLLLVKTFYLNLLVYWIIIGVKHGLDYYRKFSERELRTTELERNLAQAKLQALQMQLNPHFLFNTLHTISALMHRDVEAADRMVAKLSDLLRLALDNTDDHEVTLRQELDFLKRYLEIEQTRFRERLTVKMDISGETWEAQVPNLVLQPIVENAIRHGIEPHVKPGLIELKAHRDGANLILEVRDNGAGLPKESRHKLEGGIGVSNTRARLEQLHGPRQKLEFENAPEGGLIVRVTIPFRTE